jgi:hypothetical protein
MAIELIIASPEFPDVINPLLSRFPDLVFFEWQLSLLDPSRSNPQFLSRNRLACLIAGLSLSALLAS